MSCKTVYFDGWGSCKKLMPKVNGAIIAKKGTTFTDAELEDITNWQAKIAGSDEADRDAMYIPIHYFENTTDDTDVATTPLGVSYVNSNPIPKGVFYLDAGFNDYKQLHNLTSVEFEMWVLLQDGLMMHTKNQDGTNSGYTCQVYTKAGLPVEDKSTSYPLGTLFRYYDEFVDGLMADYGYSARDISKLSPVGLDIKVVTAYAVGGDIVVNVMQRGTNTPMTGLVIAGFPVLDTNASPTPVAVTAINEEGQGNYTLTVKKDTGGTPADVLTTESVTIQAQKVGATYLDYLSHSLTFKGNG